jgi:hypothetical protein
MRHASLQFASTFLNPRQLRRTISTGIIQIRSSGHTSVLQLSFPFLCQSLSSGQLRPELFKLLLARATAVSLDRNGIA